MQASKTNWIANGTAPSLMIDIPWASRWIYLSRNRAKDDRCFLERCSLLCWTSSTRPSLLATPPFGIASLQSSTLLTLLLAAAMAVPSCYNRTFHVRKLLKWRLCYNQGRIQELITKGGWGCTRVCMNIITKGEGGAQEYEYNYEGRRGAQQYSTM